MHVGGVEVPEPFGDALLRGRGAEVADLAVSCPQEQFARGLARLDLGRDDDARGDFEAAMSEVGDACRLEMALLDIRRRDDLVGALDTANSVARMAKNHGLAGLAWHVVGLAQGKLRRTAAAFDALRRAEEEYHAAGNTWGRAQVRDTLGMVEAARGRLDYAVQCYALSLVDKTLLGDRMGMAITLGNLGRVHLRAGRYRDAIDCFQRDLEIATQLADVHGLARIHQDIGRTLLADGKLDEGEVELRRAWDLAEEHGYPDIAFFAQKDLALLCIARGNLQAAEEAMQLAREKLPKGGEPYLQLLWDATHAELLAARHDPRAAELLERVVRGFQEAELPDLEIPARFALARVWIETGYKASAEQCLRAALKMARSDGYTRYLAALNEAMMRLELVESVLQETGRNVAEEEPTPQSYVVRERLGNGAFGEVFRVYDPSRADDFALKRLRLASVYDTKRRRSLLDSAHCELEAGSRVRHPGVARVWAIGEESTGDVYVVQDFVPGGALRLQMAADASMALRPALATLVQLAYALQALHEGGVVHRDLKPENVLLRRQDQPVLVDFGIAHVPDNAHCHAEFLSGTLPYMAPEQALGKRFDARADLYALGVIAYEWLAGRRPLELRGNTFAEQAQDLYRRRPAALSQFRPAVSTEVEQLIMSLLAKTARGRPASAERVARTLETILQSLD